MSNRCNKNHKKQGKQEEPLTFKWNEEVVEVLFNALYQYKCIIEYNSSAFHGYKARKYEAIRSSMAS